MMDVNFLENARDEIKNIFSNELESIKLGSAKELEAAKLAAAYVVLKDIFESEAGTDVKALAATLVVLETISFLAENTEIEINGKKVKVSTLSGVAEIITHTANFYTVFNTVIDDIKNPKGAGGISEETLAGILYTLSSAVDTALDVFVSKVPNAGTAALQFASKAINIALAFWYVNAESLNEAIDTNIANIKAEHDRLVNELSARTDQYVGYFDTALKKTAQISGLSVEEKSSGSGLAFFLFALKGKKQDLTLMVLPLCFKGQKARPDPNGFVNVPSEFIFLF